MRAAFLVSLTLALVGAAHAQPSFDEIGVASAGPAPQVTQSGKSVPILPAQLPAQIPSQFPGQSAAQPPFTGAIPQPQFQPAPPDGAPTYPRNTWGGNYYTNYNAYYRNYYRNSYYRPQYYYGYHRFNAGPSWNGARWYDYQGYGNRYTYPYSYAKFSRPIYTAGWYDPVYSPPGPSPEDYWATPGTVVCSW